MLDRDGTIGRDHVRADATPVEQFAAMRCLLYQCCEGKVPASRLYDELNSAAGELARRIVQDLPEYANAS